MPKKKKTDDNAAAITGMFGDPEPTPDKATPSVEDQIKALTESVATLTTANEGLVADHKKAQDLTMTLLATPAVAPAEVAPAPTTFQAAELPDPVEDPKGYFAAVNKQISDGVADQMATFRADEDAQADAELKLTNQIDGLWTRFSDAHPDLAKYRGLVNVAAQEVAESATAKGLDGEKFMFGAGSAQFLDEVAEKVNATIKSIKDGDEGGADPKKEPDNQPAPALGVLPGLPVASSGGDGDAIDKDPGAGAGGLVADIKKGQEISGFF